MGKNLQLKSKDVRDFTCCGTDKESQGLFLAAWKDLSVGRILGF